jgi:hypothetical protein
MGGFASKNNHSQRARVAPAGVFPYNTAPLPAAAVRCSRRLPWRWPGVLRELTRRGEGAKISKDYKRTIR